MTPIHLAKIENHKLIFCDATKLSDYLLQFKDEDLLEVVIKKKTRKRTQSQNSYLWGVVYKVIGDELGYDPDEVHEIMKQMFLKRSKEIVSKKNKKIVLEKTLSTTKLSTKQFSQYVDQVKRFASTDLGIYVPDAGEIEFGDYIK